MKVILRIVLVIGAAAGPFLLQADPGSSNEARVTLTGNLHPLARPEFDRGPVVSSFQMARMLMVLARTSAQQSELDGFLKDVQTPSSLQYHRWLTPSEFGRRFGPPDEQIQRVTSWLHGQGFGQVSVSAGRTAIEFSGTAAEVESALKVQIHKFAVEGREYVANTTEPSLPASIAAVARGFVGLNTFEKHQASPPVSVVRLKPEHDVPGSTTHAMSPGDFAIIYNVKPLYEANLRGNGVTIAVIADSNLAIEDIVNFREETVLSANPPELIFNGPPAAVVDTEPTLDTTWSGAIAPEARIKVVLSGPAGTSTGLDLSELYAVDNNIGDVMTESYSECEPDLSTAHQQQLSAIREQAAAQGITWVVAAGDSGAYGCIEFHTVAVFPATAPGNTLAVNGRAASPYVVAVGGTQFDDTANPQMFWAPSDSTGLVSALSYIPEIPWDQSCGPVAADCPSGIGPNVEAGSGGPSMYYPKPVWQAGVAGIPGDGQRDIPDIALAASGVHDGYLLCVSACVPGGSGNQIAHAGGTSAATPSFAGIMALIVENQGGRQGAINPYLYRMASTQNESQCNGSIPSVLPSSNCIFNDVTSGSNAIAGGDPTLYPAMTGYDLASGLGSVNAMNLASNWNSSKVPTTLTLGTGAAFIQQGAPVSFSATINANEPGPSPTGTVTFYNGAQQIGQSAVTGVMPSGLPQASASFTISTSMFAIGANSILAAYSGDAVYMPSVTPVHTLNVSNATANCAVVSFAASPNPAPLNGDGLGTTTLSINAPCVYDVRVNSPGGPLFTTNAGAESAATGAWVTDNMVFYLQLHGNTSASGTLATLTVTLAESTAPACTVSDFEAPIPVTAAGLTAGTTILVNASCAYDVRLGSTSGTLLGSATGVAQFPTGALGTSGSASLFLQLQGDTTSAGTLQTFNIPALPAGQLRRP